MEAKPASLAEKSKQALYPSKTSLFVIAIRQQQGGELASFCHGSDDGDCKMKNANSWENIDILLASLGQVRSRTCCFRTAHTSCTSNALPSSPFESGLHSSFLTESHTGTLTRRQNKAGYARCWRTLTPVLQFAKVPPMMIFRTEIQGVDT